MSKSGDLSHGIYTRILHDDLEIVSDLAAERSSTKSQILRHAIHLGLPLVLDEERASCRNINKKL